MSSGDHSGTVVRFAEYVRTVTGNDSQTRIAEQIGTNKATVWRWLHRDTTPDAALVVKLARAYGDSPVGALVAAGYVTEAETRLRSSVIVADLSRVPTSLLVAELARRADTDPDRDAA